MALCPLEPSHTSTVATIPSTHHPTPSFPTSPHRRAGAAPRERRLPQPPHRAPVGQPRPQQPQQHRVGHHVPRRRWAAGRGVCISGGGGGMCISDCFGPTGHSSIESAIMFHDAGGEREEGCVSAAGAGACVLATASVPPATAASSRPSCSTTQVGSGQGRVC